MDFKYIDPIETEARLTKDRARAAIQQIYFAKYAGQEPDANWVAEWNRLSGFLTSEETSQYIADVEEAVMRSEETQVIQAKVEQRDVKFQEAACEAVAATIADLKASVDIISESPIELVK